MSHSPAADDSATEAPVGREDGVPHALALVEQAVSVRREPVLAVVRSDGGDSSKTLAEVVVDGRAIDRVQTLQLARAVHVQALQCEENNLALTVVVVRVNGNMYCACTRTCMSMKKMDRGTKIAMKMGTL